MKLHLSSGEVFEGKAFGADSEALGEVVFTTGMTGYLETLTDPSYYGQIVVFTYPLIGNYGVFEEKDFAKAIDQTFESKKIWVKGVVLMEHAETFSHCQGFKSFDTWLRDQGIPAIYGVDTRSITQVLREKGCIMGSLSQKPLANYTDPLAGRYVPEVSPKEVTILEPNETTKTIAFIDCGAKNGIFRNFLKRGIRVIRCPFDTDPFEMGQEFDGLFFSNGPGDPATCHETIEIMRKALKQDKPIFGICLGTQIMALGAGGKTKKMKYGHRGVNQPAQDLKTKHCIITSQNHGYEVDETSLPDDFEVWFRNLNDQTVEGIRHKSKPIFAVQFHPEACGGPEDAEYLFDQFIEVLGKSYSLVLEL
ncbi:MAG TPA: glutamine-hydrolyzing carbamoyl-phosphate synthase small subunit [Candidatus Gracilibacteria bacterium]